MSHFVQFVCPVPSLAPPIVPENPFLGEGSPTKNGTLILASTREPSSGKESCALPERSRLCRSQSSDEMDDATKHTVIPEILRPGAYGGCL